MHRDEVGATANRFGRRNFPLLDEEDGTWSEFDRPRLVSEGKLSLLLARFGASLAEVLADCLASRMAARLCS